MAFNTTQGNDEYVASGPLGVAGQATTRRKFDLPGLMVFQERTYAKLDNILMNFLPRIMVADPEPKFLSRNEAPIKFDVKSDDTDTNNEGDTIRMSDTQAVFLQAGDVLQVPQLFCDSDGANYTTTKYGSAYFPETVIVDTVDLSGASANVANVFVKRGNGFSTAAAAAGTVLTILSEYKLIKMHNTIQDGGNAPNPIDFEPFATQNYVQGFSRTWADTSIEAEMDVYGKETFAEKASRKRREFFREIEWSLFDGRKGKHQVSGFNQWTTGGVVEIVQGASSSLDGENRLIDFGGAFDLERQREIDEIVFRYGREVKDMFSGGQYFTVLFNSLEKLITVNDALSRKYGWQVVELSLGHGTYRIHRHPKFTDQTTSGTTGISYAKDAVIADLEYLRLMIMKGHNVQVKSNIQAPRAHRREDELFCWKGLYRQFFDAHSVIYGVTA